MRKIQIYKTERKKTYPGIKKSAKGILLLKEREGEKFGAE